MANMIDYLVWRGELTLEASPWNEVDGLLLATLSYLNFHGIQHPKGWTLEELKRLDAVIPSTSSSYPLRKQAFEGMADSIRFGKSRVHHFIAMTDETKTMQFSAMCVDLPDGTMGVAFRGTDNTMIGWREDFNMAYQTRVPGQIAAEYYLTRAAQATDKPLRVTGHSKGGNLAVYAAASVAPEVQEPAGIRRARHEPGNFLRRGLRTDPGQDPVVHSPDEHYRPADGLLPAVHGGEIDGRRNQPA